LHDVTFEGQSFPANRLRIQQLSEGVYGLTGDADRVGNWRLALQDAADGYYGLGERFNELNHTHQVIRNGSQDNGAAFRHDVLQWEIGKAPEIRGFRDRSFGEFRDEITPNLCNGLLPSDAGCRCPTNPGSSPDFALTFLYGKSDTVYSNHARDSGKR
jgi:hypothetical protein